MLPWFVCLLFVAQAPLIMLCTWYFETDNWLCLNTLPLYPCQLLPLSPLPISCAHMHCINFIFHCLIKLIFIYMNTTQRCDQWSPPSVIQWLPIKSILWFECLILTKFQELGKMRSGLTTGLPWHRCVKKQFFVQCILTLSNWVWMRWFCLLKNLRPWTMTETCALIMALFYIWAQWL